MNPYRPRPDESRRVRHQVVTGISLDRGPNGDAAHGSHGALAGVQDVLGIGGEVPLERGPAPVPQGTDDDVLGVPAQGAHEIVLGGNPLLCEVHFLVWIMLP